MFIFGSIFPDHMKQSRIMRVDIMYDMSFFIIAPILTRPVALDTNERWRWHDVARL